MSEPSNLTRLPLVGSDTPVLQAMLRVIRRLATARSVPEIMAVVTPTVRDLTGADGVTFVLREGDQCYYADEDAISPLWKGRRFPMSACISGWCMTECQPAVIQDIYSDPRIPQEAYRSTFVHSLIMVPVPQDDPVAAIGAYWKDEHMAAPEQVELLQCVGNATALALSAINTRAEESGIASPPRHEASFSPSNETEPLLRKLASILDLDETAREAIRSLPLRVITYPARTDIVREGEQPSESCAILSGLACRYKMTPEGRRQIVSFHTAGDLPGLESLFVDRLDHSLATLSECRVGFISHDAIRDLCTRHPTVAQALWKDTFVGAAIFREWMVNIGRRSTYQRLAHLICEVATRMRAVGLIAGDIFTFNVTQAELADAIGVSTVHVNRTVQQLRQDGLVAFERSEVTIMNWDALRRVADFDPTYLRQVKG